MEAFVENLVSLMTPEDLELQNKFGNTAVCLAAANENVNFVKTMLQKNPGLLDIPGVLDMMPLSIASLFGHRAMVNYIYDNSDKMKGKFWTHPKRTWVLERCLEANLFDIVLKMVKEKEELAWSGNVLSVLAPKTDACKPIKLHFIQRFSQIICMEVGPAEKPSDAICLLRIVWGNIMKLPKDTINEIINGPADVINEDEKTTLGDIANRHVGRHNILKGADDPIMKGKTALTPENVEDPKVARPKHSYQILFVAAEMGNTEFIVELIRKYPDLIWKINDNNQSIFHVAVTHRHEGIYNLLYEIGSMKYMITALRDAENNNMLHLVGKIAKTKRLQDVSGVALQMQRELLWLKEVESMVPSNYRNLKNNDGLTPHELFSKEHKDLMAASEKWMKVTASQSMVVATLITTIVFAAAFTIPGGYDETSGFPKFISNRAFVAFVVADTISLTFSSISILIFLSILTSRYAEDDFVEKLPKRLMSGLATLFLSIASMMVAFSVSFFVFYYNNLIWVPTIVSGFACVPVILYVIYQSDLLMDVYHWTYASKELFKPTKFKLYYQNPKS